MEELLKYFDWVALVMASVGTSLVLAVINQTNKGQEVHNGWIALGISTFFSILLINWTGFLVEWQSIVLQFTITILVSCRIAVSKGQNVVDSVLGFLLDKANIKGNDDAPK